MPEGADDVPARFVCVMLLVTASLDMIQRSLEDVIGPNDSPIKYVATLVAFLARLHPHKSEFSLSKTRSYPREFNPWAMSSLRMVSVLTMTISPVAHIKQLRGLFDGFSYNLKSLPNLTRGKCPITILLKSQQKTLFMLSLEGFNDWGGRGYDDFVPEEVTKTAPSGGETT